MNFGRLLRVLHAATPPALWKIGTLVRDQAARQGFYRPEWQYLRGGWQEAAKDPRIRGWDHPSVERTQRKNWSVWKQTIAEPAIVGCAYETPHGAPDRPDTHHQNLILAYAALLAAQGRETLSVLDWGSGAGHSYEILRSLAPHLRLNYHGCDFPDLVSLGRELAPEAHFHADETWLDQRYDLVIAGSSLSYAMDWQSILAKLATATGGYLLISRQPLTRGPSYVFVQRPYRYGYETEYAGWCLGRDDLVTAAIRAGLALARDMMTADTLRIIGAPTPCHIGALLFKRTAASPR